MSKIVTNNITPRSGSSVGLTGDLAVSGNITGGAVSGTTGTFTGNVSVGGTLTYEDVTNIDSVGLITARSGIRIGTGGTVGPASAGIVTYYGDGSQLTGIQVGTRDFVGFGTNITARKAVGLGSDGTIRAIKVVGSVFAVGSAVQFEAGGSFDLSSAYSTTDNKLVTLYRDYGDGNKGKSVVSTITGDSVSFGNVVEFGGASTKNTSIAYDPDTDRVVGHYIDVANTNYPTWTVGEVQSTQVSWGSTSSHYSNDAGNGETAVVYDTTNNKIVLIWGNDAGPELKTFTGDVSGGSSNTLNLGSSQEIGSNAPGHLTALWHAANSRTVVFFEDITDSNKGKYSVGTYNSSGSGNAQTWSTPTAFTTGAIDVIKSAYDSTNARMIIVYRDTANSSYGTARVGSLSGDTITWGDAVVFNSGDTENIACSWDSVAEKVIIVYKDAGNSDKGTCVIGTISGGNKRTITFSDEAVFNSSSTSTVDVGFDVNAQKTLITYSDGGISGDGKGVVITDLGGSGSTNLTTENYIGLAVAGISSGATGSVTIPGGISSGHTGLTTARTYYVQTDGTLATSAGNPSVVAGTSLSDTEILIR